MKEKWDVLWRTITAGAILTAGCVGGKTPETPVATTTGPEGANTTHACSISPDVLKSIEALGELFQGIKPNGPLGHIGNIGDTASVMSEIFMGTGKDGQGKTVVLTAIEDGEADKCAVFDSEGILKDGEVTLLEAKGGDARLTIVGNLPLGQRIGDGMITVNVDGRSYGQEIGVNTNADAQPTTVPFVSEGSGEGSVVVSFVEKPLDDFRPEQGKVVPREELPVSTNVPLNTDPMSDGVDPEYLQKVQEVQPTPAPEEIDAEASPEVMKLEKGATYTEQELQVIFEAQKAKMEDIVNQAVADGSYEPISSILSPDWNRDSSGATSEQYKGTSVNGVFTGPTFFLSEDGPTVKDYWAVLKGLATKLNFPLPQIQGGAVARPFAYKWANGEIQHLLLVCGPRFGASCSDSFLNKYAVGSSAEVYLPTEVYYQTMGGMKQTSNISGNMDFHNDKNEEWAIDRGAWVSSLDQKITIGNLRSGITDSEGFPTPIVYFLTVKSGK
jgi:hypothetical protein